MKRAVHKLRYFCSDAWDEWRHSKAVNLMALGTLAAALFLAGLVMLVLSNVDRRVQTLRDEIRVQVYLTDEYTEQDREALERRLGAMDGVERVLYVDKDEALRRYRRWAADVAELINEFESNPLPASFEVYLVPGVGAVEAGERIATGLADEKAVEEVRFDEQWLGRLEGMVDLGRVGGGALAVLVFIAVVFVMASVLRLAVYARQDEIEIMQLVGATPGFIRGPFLVAGAAQGLIASGLALLIVEGVRRLSLAVAASAPAALLDLFAARPLSPSLSGLLLLIGILVSLTGSYFAVRQPA